MAKDFQGQSQKDEKTPLKYKAGRWNEQEHAVFLRCLKDYGKDWNKISKVMKERSPIQVRSHAQKFFRKVARNQKENSIDNKGVSKEFLSLKKDTKVLTSCLEMAEKVETVCTCSCKECHTRRVLFPLKGEATTTTTDDSLLFAALDKLSENGILEKYMRRVSSEQDKTEVAEKSCGPGGLVLPHQALDTPSNTVFDWEIPQNLKRKEITPEQFGNSEETQLKRSRPESSENSLCRMISLDSSKSDALQGQDIGTQHTDILLNESYGSELPNSGVPDTAVSTYPTVEREDTSSENLQYISRINEPIMGDLAVLNDLIPTHNEEKQFSTSHVGAIQGC